MKPFQPIENERQSKVRLHVRRMFITDEAELLPSWLRFVQGVVDTEDLPLNVSREMLQSTPALAKIRKAVTGRVISELTNRAKKGEDYESFWENFGPVLKEGIYEDFERRAEIAPAAALPLLRRRGLDVAGRLRVPHEGRAGGDLLPRGRRSGGAEVVRTQLEGFRARGLEVLLLSDHVDAFWPDQLGTFEGKSLHSVTKGNIDLSKFAPEAARPRRSKAIEAFVAALKTALGDDVSDVKVTDRWSTALSCSRRAARVPIFRCSVCCGGRARRIGKPALEINPRHGLIRALASAPESELAESAGMLLDLARIQDGDSPRDPADFARKVAAALASAVPPLREAE